MSKLFVICGHGDGDPGACSGGYSEADLVRKLASRMKALGGSSVTVGDTSVNWYASDWISKGKCPSGVPVIELHMDSASASAKGGHVIICSQFDADDYDKKLAEHCRKMFPGRSVTISKRGDLANPNRAAAMGVNYRLLENCFISNASDREKFIDQMDDVARSILACFGISSDGSASGGSSTSGGSTSGGSSKKSVATLAKEVIAGKWGNGDTRRKKLEAAGYDYDAVQAEVNRQLGVGNSSGGSSSSSGGSVKVGAKVKLKKQVDYNGTSLDMPGTYTVSEVNGDRVVVNSGSTVMAAVKKSNLTVVSGGGTSSSSGGSKSWKVGAKVKVTNPYDENGTHLAVSGTYTIMEISGNRVVIGKGGVVTAAMPKGNLRLV